MKKIVLFFLIACMFVGLTACGFLSENSVSLLESSEESESVFDGFFDLYDKSEQEDISSDESESIDASVSDENEESVNQNTEQSTEVKEQMVWIPKSGSKYHSKAGCSNMKNPTQVTKSEAEAMGYTPCKRCH
ncbi:MAG: hypothetical protein IJD82_08925 [Clostridia bacterium]|nr:hypothetical protein [Clostridia bacterium]